MRLSPKKGLGFSEFDSEEPPCGRESAFYIFLAAKFQPPGFGIQVGTNTDRDFYVFDPISINLECSNVSKTIFKTFLGCT